MNTGAEPLRPIPDEEGTSGVPDGGSGGSASPALEELLAECAERLDLEGESAVAELCARHPEYANELRRALAPLLDFGVVGPHHEEQPEHIGRYSVRQRLGEGSFGIVYLGVQTEPIRRKVAIKVLRPGAGDRTTLARFEAERHVLAMMSHPAVAHVLDAGALPDGRPYFVMEYVDGPPLTTYCDRHRLAIAARLELFLALCDGVQAAHQRGIIHRDLKPSNILVKSLDERPLPKIIDFGLAKALRPLEAEGVFETESGRVLGTPGFMSPEQALGRGADVDTRTDVFALGVLLFLVLTGEMPWKAELALTPLTRAPERPSTRVGSDKQSTKATAALRSTQPRELAARLRGDLDWIALKALEPERERRYASVLELTADLRRHLRDEPVLARPPSIPYQVRKFVRRHRIPVIAAVAVLLTLVLGLVTAWVFAVQAQTHLDRFQILAIDSRLRRAKSVAKTLPPSWPDRLERFDRWLEVHGQPLKDELPRLTTALAELRELALPWTEADREEERRSNPWALEAESQRARRDYLDSLLAHPFVEQESFADLRNTLGKTREQADKDFAIATQRAEERRRWQFEDDGHQFLHDTMTQLRTELGDFAEGPESYLAKVQAARDAIAKEIRELEPRMPLWDQVAAEVLADPRYRGLRLVPQAQLVPLGRDPHSGLQEFLHTASTPIRAPIPSRNEDGTLQLGVDDGIVFVLLPGGDAWIGAQRDDANAPCYDPNASVSEAPVHQVSLAPFFLSKHEITQAQWLRMTGNKPSALHEKRTSVGSAPFTRRHPVENLSWDDGKTALEQQGLDLPTEVQWEYACRAGTTTTWPTGSSPPSLLGFACLPGLDDDGASLTHHLPVGSYAPNAFGLCDMVGNVAEWCRDNFSSLAYLLPTQSGDGGRPVPQMQVRAVRGGSFQDPASEGSSAARNAKPFNHRGEWLGVRAARRVEAAR